MSDLENGVIHFRIPGGSIALTVRHGVIVECHPAREWPIGRKAVELWSDATAYGATLRWENECPTAPALKSHLRLVKSST